jgi:hypothetical protein
MFDAVTRNLSYFRMLKKLNPDKYHQIETYRDMYLSQRKLGDKFYDLIEELAQ